MSSKPSDRDELQFVVTVGTLRALADRHNQRIIRSHAMSRFRKEQREARILRGSRDEPGKAITIGVARVPDMTLIEQFFATKDVADLDLNDEDLGKDIRTMREAWLAWLATTLSGPSYLGNSDPFSSLPTGRMDQEMRALKTHCA